MSKTLYYTDQDFEHFMARSERSLKVQFYVWFVCFLIVQAGIWIILQTDDHLSGSAQLFLIVVSLIALVCLIGLWYCWMSVRKSRMAYQKRKQEQQEEVHALLDEIEESRQKKLNQDL